MSRRSAEAQAGKATGSKNPYERQLERYNMLRGGVVSATNNLLGALESDSAPCTGLNLIRRDDGGFLAIIKRDNDLIAEVMMAYGEDVWSALLALNKKLARADWKVDTPWQPPKNSGG